MPKQTITRYSCDAPNCEDVFEFEGPAATATVQVLDQGAPLPDGWVELQVTGASPGGEQRLVYASKPECAAALAEEQVAQAVVAGEQRQKEQEEEAERIKKATETAQEVAQENEEGDAADET